MTLSGWPLVRETAISEFSDMTNTGEVTRMLLCLTLTAGMGRESTAVLSTLLALGIFTLMSRVDRLLDKPAVPAAGASPPDQR